MRDEHSPVLLDSTSGAVMILHPQVQALIDTMANGPALDFSTLDAAEFRAAFDVPAPSAPGVTLAHVEDRIIEADTGPLGVRLYYPHGDGPFPITLYFHGSAFVVGSPDTTDGICRTLAKNAHTLVISVDYRLAPEAPFPAAVNDACAALHWVHAHAIELRGIASRIAVGGDSAGGNIAAVLAQQARQDGPQVCHQLLLYPVLDCSFETESYKAYASAHFLGAEMMRWAWRQYLPDPRMAQDVRASPLRETDLAGVASATIFTAEYDILRDEAETYALALRDAGVAVHLKRWPGQVHAFMLMQGVLDDADTALMEAAEALRCAFA